MNIHMRSRKLVLFALMIGNGVMISGYLQTCSGPETIGRVVDLTRVIEPTAADHPRKFVVHIHDALEELPGKVRPEDEWYVMSDVELMNHVGTHIETPFHCLKNGMDMAGIPVHQLIGEAAILDLSEAEADSGVTLAQVQSAAEKAGGCGNAQRF